LTDVQATPCKVIFCRYINCMKTVNGLHDVSISKQD